MAMLFLIDTRGRPERPEPPDPWHRRLPRPSRRQTLWLVTVSLLLVAGLVVGGLVGSLLLLAWLGVVCAGVTAAIPYGHGITEHRQ
jgi:fatty acid desaturase